MNIDRTVRRVRNLASDVDLDDVLEYVGLQQRRTALSAILPAIGILGAGILVGAGLGLLFAPTSGKVLRREAEGKVNDIKGRLTTAKTQGIQQISGAVGDVKQNLEDRFASKPMTSSSTV